MPFEGSGKLSVAKLPGYKIFSVLPFGCKSARVHAKPLFYLFLRLISAVVLRYERRNTSRSATAYLCNRIWIPDLRMLSNEISWRQIRISKKKRIMRIAPKKSTNQNRIFPPAGVRSVTIKYCPNKNPANEVKPVIYPNRAINPDSGTNPAPEKLLATTENADSVTTPDKTSIRKTKFACGVRKLESFWEMNSFGFCRIRISPANVIAPSVPTAITNCW